MDIQKTFTRIIHEIMNNNSGGIKGASFSCSLLSTIYQGYNGDERKELLALTETFSIRDYGYEVLEYNEGTKVFYYKP